MTSADGRESYGFQSVERWHARPGLIEIETRIGKADPLLRRAGHKRQGKTLACEPTRVRGEVAADLLAHCIEQNRLLDNLARKHLFREPWRQHCFKAKAPRRLDRPHEDFAVALRRRGHGRLQEEAFKDDQNLRQPYGTDRSHWGQLGQHREHPVGSPERSGRECAKPVEPLAPMSSGGESVKLIDERKGVAGEGREVLERPR